MNAKPMAWHEGDVFMHHVLYKDYGDKTSLAKVYKYNRYDAREETMYPIFMKSRHDEYDVTACWCYRSANR